MIQAIYSELDGPAGVTRRLEVKGHAGYAPAGQDIVCAGASILTQALVWMTAEAEQAACTASDGPEGPRVVITAQPGPDARENQRMAGGFDLAKAGFALLAERYPDNLRFADTSSRGEEGMIDLQLFAKKDKKGPVLSREQQRQAMAEGTMGRRKKAEETQEPPAQPKDAAPLRPQEQPRREPMMGIGEVGRFIRALHRQWAREEAELRRGDPKFSFREALKSPAMRRMMRMPGMRMQEAYHAAFYDQLMAGTARTVEQGVVNRVQERGARPAENGIHSKAAVTTAPDVSRMSRAQREAIEREALHGAKIRL